MDACVHCMQPFLAQHLQNWLMAARVQQGLLSQELSALAKKGRFPTLVERVAAMEPKAKKDQRLEA